MNKECPLCHYVRTEADTAPEWQCPGCERAYSKMGKAITPGSQNEQATPDILVQAQSEEHINNDPNTTNSQKSNSYVVKEGYFSQEKLGHIAFVLAVLATVGVFLTQQAMEVIKEKRKENIVEIRKEVNQLSNLTNKWLLDSTRAQYSSKYTLSSIVRNTSIAGTALLETKPSSKCVQKAHKEIKRAVIDGNVIIADLLLNPESASNKSGLRSANQKARLALRKLLQCSNSSK